MGPPVAMSLSVERPQRGSRFLIEASLAPSTVKKYKQAVSLFLEWCGVHGLAIDTLEQLDDHLTDYFHDVYVTGGGVGKGLASATLYGVMKFLPRARGGLPTAEESLRGWMRLQEGKSYPPLTWDATVVMALQMVRHGWLRHAVAILVAFDCLLRVGELVNLRKGDVADSGDRRLGSEYRGLALRLASTKTGPNQWVQVQDRQVQALLREVSGSCSKPTDRLFPFTAADFRDKFKIVRDELGLSSLYVPHSLRHGGAPRCHLLGWSVEDILLRGRWASVKSARRYVQAGRAMLLTMDVPLAVSQVAKRIVPHIALAFEVALSQLHTSVGGGDV